MTVRLSAMRAGASHRRAVRGMWVLRMAASARRPVMRMPALALKLAVACS